MRVLLLLLIICNSAACFAESAAEREMKQLKDQRDAAVTASTKAHDDRYRTALELVYRRAIQAKDTAGAEALKTELLKYGPLRDIAPPTAGATTKPSLPGTMFGEWKVNDATGWTATYNFKADGTCERLPGSAKVPDKVATWSKQKDKIEVVWPDGKIQAFELPIKGGKLVGLSPDGARLWAVKAR